MTRPIQALKNYLNNLVLSRADYHGDGMAVWDKNIDFIDDPKFLQAYNQAVNSGHYFTNDDVKLKVEWRVNTALWAAKQAAKLEGDFVECGVNTGILSIAICQYLDFNQMDKSFYLFDTYNGIPEDQLSYAESVANIKQKNVYYYDCYEVTKKNFSHWPRAHLVRGKVPDTLNMVDIKKVSYLSLDMNVADPEIEAIRYFWPKLVSGGVILLDDYGWATCEQQKLAFDNFSKDVGSPILFVPTGQGIIVKR